MGVVTEVRGEEQKEEMDEVRGRGYWALVEDCSDYFIKFISRFTRLKARTRVLVKKAVSILSLHILQLPSSR